MSVVADRELVVHVFAHADGPARGEAWELVRAAWRRCADALNMTAEVARLDLPIDPPEPGLVRAGSVPLAARQRSDTCAQAILRVEHDVLNLSLLLSGPDATWPVLASDLAAVVGDMEATAAPGLIGIAWLYLGKVSAADRRVPTLVPAIAQSLPPGLSAESTWRGAQLSTDVALWETSEPVDNRVERQFVVLAPPDRDVELSRLTWSWDGGPALPRLARYLMHAAKLRFQLRVYETFPGPGPLCQLLDAASAQLSGGGPVDAVRAASATLRAWRFQAAQLLTALRTMRQTVDIAVSNAFTALGPVAVQGNGTSPFDDDRALGTYLVQRLQDDIMFLDTADDGARRVSELAGRVAAPPDTAANDPTFGIITALPEEFVAARAMLDDPRRRQVRGDRANYVIGTMPSAAPDQPHTVVVTMLGETANSAAADGCANLVRSFSTVNCVLMVGIAAGMPAPDKPLQHVRLGDVVVASWGIVDYDHVVDTPEGVSLRQPHPRPSPLLGHAAKLLEADERTGLRPWEALLDTALRTLPYFARPPADTDLVYADDSGDRVLPHPDPALSRHRPGWPRVHYGRIGSADRSLRDLARRDELATRHGLRAIEMEGTGIGKAGFAGGVEWYVVRGISDYGDRRTGPAWRDHAALVAAAYAKALLGNCPPLEPCGGHTRAVPGT